MNRGIYRRLLSDESESWWNEEKKIEGKNSSKTHPLVFVLLYWSEDLSRWYSHRFTCDFVWLAETTTWIKSKFKIKIGNDARRWKPLLLLHHPLLEKDWQDFYQPHQVPRGLLHEQMFPKSCSTIPKTCRKELCHRELPGSLLRMWVVLLQQEVSAKKQIELSYYWCRYCVLCANSRPKINS